MSHQTRAWFTGEAARFAWIDFEASRLGEGSFPTEVGWAIVAGGAVVSGACLIKLTPAWLAVPNAWSDASEQLTGITLDMLDRDGVPPTEVVSILTAALQGRLLLSDNQAFDGWWFGALFRAAGVSTATWMIGDTTQALEYAAAKAGLRRIDRMEIDLAAFKDSPTKHRAEPDARRLAVRWGIIAGLISP